MHCVWFLKPGNFFDLNKRPICANFKHALGLLIMPIIRSYHFKLCRYYLYAVGSIKACTSLHRTFASTCVLEYCLSNKN